MSNIEIRLANFIVKEHFGENVAKIVVDLLHKGKKNLRTICHDTSLNKELVKKCISVGIKHRIIKFEEYKKQPSTYEAIIESILLRARYPKFVYYAKMLFGDVAELIVESVLMNGAEIISDIVSKVTERLVSDMDQSSAKHDESFVYQKCEDLIKGHYLKRLELPTDLKENSTGGEISSHCTEDKAYEIPPGIKQGIRSKRKKISDPSEEPPLKKSKSDARKDDNNAGEKVPDEGVYWHVNFETFHQYSFDELIRSAVLQKFDQSAATIVGTMLRESAMERSAKMDATRSFTFHEIMRKLPSLPVVTEQQAVQYLALLSDKKSCGFLSKTDESGGGKYRVDLKRCVDMLSQHTVESVVRERLGGKACRIFRILILKKNLEQKQIEELAMIPFKETKELLYKLLQERLISLQEVSKSGDFTPSRTFYLFSVDFPLVARLLLNRSYQTIANMMSKREQLMIDNKRLLEKNERIEGILSALSSNEQNQDVVIQELEELITPTEKEQLQKLKKHLARLESGEVQVDETVEILKQYTLFH